MKKHFLILLILSASSIFGEIDFIEVSWRSEICRQSCANDLQKQFDRLSGAEEVTINLSGGYALIRWKKNVPFNYTELSYAMRMVGPTMKSLRIKVHGNIRTSREGAILVSTGDGTSFQLLSPMTPSTTQQTLRYNPESYQLSADMLDRLTTAEQQGQEATVEGMLLRPVRTPPYNLVIEQLRFSKPKGADTNNRRMLEAQDSNYQQQ